MDAETSKHALFAASLALLEKIRNVAAAALYFLAAHIYDGLCYAVSNIVSYQVALVIMTAILFSASAALVYLHDLLSKLFLWDILRIKEINNLVNANSISKNKLSEKLLRWIFRRGRLWIHLLGSITIGPPVVTLLLRKKENWKSTLFYLVSGTLLSVSVWVTIWAGVGKVTWEQYVMHLIQTAIN